MVFKPEDALEWVQEHKSELPKSLRKVGGAPQCRARRSTLTTHMVSGTEPGCKGRGAPQDMAGGRLGQLQLRAPAPGMFPRCL